MPIQFKLNETTGEISDVKIVRAPRDARTYNQNYYHEKIKKQLTCEHCGATLSRQLALNRHQERSVKCQLTRAKKQVDEALKQLKQSVVPMDIS